MTSKLTSLLLISVLSLTFFSCSKEPDGMGLDVQPPSDRIGASFSDTTQIIAFSVLEDSVVTSRLSQNVVGCINDPYFGKTISSMYTQFNLPSRDIVFSGNPILDSVVLVIAYRGFYGDTTSGVNFRVYEIAEDLKSEGSYYQNSVVETFQKPLNADPNAYLTSRVMSSVVSATDTVNPAFRIRLNTNWARTRFFEKSGQPELSTNENFRSYFKGLMITATGAKGLGHMVYLGINKSTTSGIYCYYHTATENNIFRLLVEDDCVRGNSYNHDNYQSAIPLIRNQVLLKDSSLGAFQLYLQPGGGINTKIKFPTIREQFKNRRVVINRAELVITNLISNTNGFYVPAKLTLAQNTVSGGYQFLPDDAITEGDEYFGGNYDKLTNEYRFRITRYIQKLINTNDADFGMTLFISGRAVYANRLIFAGYRPNAISSRAKPLRLEISYTYLD